MHIWSLVYCIDTDDEAVFRMKKGYTLHYHRTLTLKAMTHRQVEMHIQRSGVIYKQHQGRSWSITLLARAVIYVAEDGFSQYNTS